MKLVDRSDVVTPLEREFFHSRMLIFTLCMCLCLAGFGFISKKIAATRKEVVLGFFFRFKIKSKTPKQSLSCQNVSVTWFF